MLFRSFRGVDESRHSGSEWVVPLKTTSIEAAKYFDDGILDFVFIDAEHTFEAVVSDIRAWLPKVKHGGCIAGHDYSWDGVKRAVEQELAGKYKQLGSCWIVPARNW